jgi:DNA-binding SARP family transcriptional activator
MDELDFGMLGPLEARRDGTPLPLGGWKQRALLAMLLVHAGGAVAAERLVDEIGTTPGAVQVYVARLRQVLGRDAIATRPTGYAICTEGTRIDATMFERLVGLARQADAGECSRLLGEALSLWRGRALADFGGAPFVRAAAVRLEELRVAAEERRIEAELELGRQADVVPRLAALVVEHPYREPLRALLMTALYRLGRQADALAVYRDVRRLLAEDLGLEPGPALRGVERSILRQRET